MTSCILWDWILLFMPFNHVLQAQVQCLMAAAFVQWYNETLCLGPLRGSSTRTDGGTIGDLICKRRPVHQTCQPWPGSISPQCDIPIHIPKGLNDRDFLWFWVCVIFMYTYIYIYIVYIYIITYIYIYICIYIYINNICSYMIALNIFESLLLRFHQPFSFRPSHKANASSHRKADSQAVILKSGTPRSHGFPVSWRLGLPCAAFTVPVPKHPRACASAKRAMAWRGVEDDENNLTLTYIDHHWPLTSNYPERYPQYSPVIVQSTFFFFTAPVAIAHSSPWRWLLHRKGLHFGRPTAWEVARQLATRTRPAPRTQRLGPRHWNFTGTPWKKPHILRIQSAMMERWHFSWIVTVNENDGDRICCQTPWERGIQSSIYNQWQPSMV